jgi:hypothetical protein
MVKGEVDIVEDWVLYHGQIFGFRNIYVIDNMSLDGTYESLLMLKKKYGINVTRLPDYTKKGEYMTMLLRSISNNELVFPIDIDEFIVYYDKKTNTINCNNNGILNYIKKLPALPIYKMNYINVKTFNPEGYARATVEAKNGYYSDYKTMAKSFFHSGLFKGVIDHGNHYNTNNYLPTKLCLVHFHQRNLDQIKKKVYNNVRGLGYSPFNLNSLLSLKSKGSDVIGFHHIDKQIKIITKTFKLDVDEQTPLDISLEPLNTLLINLKA